MLGLQKEGTGGEEEKEDEGTKRQVQDGAKNIKVLEVHEGN